MHTRDQIYQPGLPAEPGRHYRAFVRFAEHAGDRVLDLGCGYAAYGLELAKLGRQCIGCDINFDYLQAAASSGLPVIGVHRAGLLKPRFFSRLYAVASVR